MELYFFQKFIDLANWSEENNHLQFYRHLGYDDNLFLLKNPSLLNSNIFQTGSLNCAAFEAGIIEAVLDGCNFPAKVSAHWHKGTTFMVKFDEQVIARDKLMD